jgi:hypothetical protein
VSAFDAVWNLGRKATRRLQSAHKPLVRYARRNSREQEHQAFRDEAQAIERRLAAVAATPGPIVVGPWLAEVGYEVLYWLPFLRWFQDAHAVPRERLIVVSRGGLDHVYRPLAGGYVDLFDLATPQELASRNAERRAAHEGGGQKQSDAGAFDRELIERARKHAGASAGPTLHPSLLFGLFRHVWYGNLPMDVLWRHVRHALVTDLPTPALPGLPESFIAARLYAGPALSTSVRSVDAIRTLVARAARVAPVVLLDYHAALDEHVDFDLRGIEGVSSAGAHMAARDNLGLQAALIARSRFFLGTCGGLAWLAPFLGVPTVAVYDDDRLIAPHLLVARHAGGLVKAAEFTPLDLRALARIGLPGAGSTGTAY